MKDWPLCAVASVVVLSSIVVASLFVLATENQTVIQKSDKLVFKPVPRIERAFAAIREANKRGYGFARCRDRSNHGPNRSPASNEQPLFLRLAPAYVQMPTLRAQG